MSFTQNDFEFSYTSRIDVVSLTNVEFRNIYLKNFQLSTTVINPDDLKSSVKPVVEKTKLPQKETVPVEPKKRRGKKVPEKEVVATVENEKTVEDKGPRITINFSNEQLADLDNFIDILLEIGIFKDFLTRPNPENISEENFMNQTQKGFSSTHNITWLILSFFGDEKLPEVDISNNHQFKTISNKEISEIDTESLKIKNNLDSIVKSIIDSLNSKKRSSKVNIDPIIFMNTKLQNYLKTRVKSRKLTVFKAQKVLFFDSIKDDETKKRISKEIEIWDSENGKFITSSPPQMVFSKSHSNDPFILKVTEISSENTEVVSDTNIPVPEKANEINVKERRKKTNNLKNQTKGNNSEIEELKKEIERLKTELEEIDRKRRKEEVKENNVDEEELKELKKKLIDFQDEVELLRFEKKKQEQRNEDYKEKNKNFKKKIKKYKKRLTETRNTTEINESQEKLNFYTEKETELERLLEQNKLEIEEKEKKKLSNWINQLKKPLK